MLLEEVVVAEGEVRTVVAATAFFAGQSGACHQESQRVKVAQFVVMATGMGMVGKLHFFQNVDGGGEFFAGAENSNVAPHEIANLSQGCGGGSRFGGRGSGGRRQA